MTVQAACFNVDHLEERAENASSETLLLKKAMSPPLLSCQGHNMTLRAIPSLLLQIIAGPIPDQGPELPRETEKDRLIPKCNPLA